MTTNTQPDDDRAANGQTRTAAAIEAYDAALDALDATGYDSTATLSDDIKRRKRAAELATLDVVRESGHENLVREFYQTIAYGSYGTDATLTDVLATLVGHLRAHGQQDEADASDGTQDVGGALSALAKDDEVRVTYRDADGETHTLTGTVTSPEGISGIVTISPDGERLLKANATAGRESFTNPDDLLRFADGGGERDYVTVTHVEPAADADASDADSQWDHDYSEGDTVTFEWTDGSLKTGEIAGLWRDHTSPSDPASATVTVTTDEWPDGRDYDIAVSWIRASAADFA